MLLLIMDQDTETIVNLLALLTQSYVKLFLKQSVSSKIFMLTFKS